MLYSHTIAYIAIRFGLAAVFLWFGIDKFIHPDYWIITWVPQWFIAFIDSFSAGSDRFIYILGTFEILVALSFILDVFTKFFAVAAIIFLVGISVSLGLNEVLVRDIGLLGALVALFFWPKQKRSHVIHL